MQTILLQLHSGCLIYKRPPQLHINAPLEICQAGVDLRMIRTRAKASVTHKHNSCLALLRNHPGSLLCVWRDRRFPLGLIMKFSVVGEIAKSSAKLISHAPPTTRPPAHVGLMLVAHLLAYGQAKL